ncbi:MAG: flagellar hook-basal body complex protein [Calditrichaeota bacterium]|nr:flagellar hook-basal body complex protein [Calditrichota bacterium]
MMRSLYAGISGLRNFQAKMDIIGNNIANVNTAAFKGSRITFAETIAQTLSGEIAPTEGLGGVNPIQVGLGMRTLSVDTNFAQGSLEATGNMTDLAVQGDGFFMVSDGTQTFYTRAGSFHLDGQGNLVTAGGQKVLGYIPDPNRIGELDRAKERPINIPLGKQSQAKATSEVQLRGNLDMHMSQSTASLVNAGETGIRNISGRSRDGVGGRHRIEITGENATRSTGSGATEGLNLTNNLRALGIADVSGFTVVVDGDRSVRISGLTIDSTISDLLHAINSQVAGVSAQLDANGAIQITRLYSGEGQRYNVELRDTGDSNVVATLFDEAGTFRVENGTSSTLVAVDNFTPNATGVMVARALNLEVDERTGLVNGIRDLGGGGVFVNAPLGLQAGTATIDTADTRHSTSLLVYDSLGNTHNFTANFTRTETPGVWRWSVNLQEPAVLIEGGSGQVTFNADASLQSFTYDGNLNHLTFNPGNGAQNIDVVFNPGSFNGFDGLTQTSSSTTAMATGQDGYGPGTLQGLYIDINGQIFGNYSNGKTEILSQILLANFTNPQGLERVGENLYRQTTNTGQPRITSAAQAGAKVNAGYLEMSNVDLSREFTDMILVQRAFQAAARVITSSDGLLQEITQLKR